MLILLSPAKKLDYDSVVRTTLHSQPQFVEQAQGLINVLKQKPASEIASLMKLSEPLAQLNAQRYSAWVPEFNLRNSRQAILAFNGDVYAGLDATGLSDQQLEWAQQHVAILSGLYGVLRPLDLMQPYRLEMGTRLPTDVGVGLYSWWGTTIANYLNQHLQSAASSPSGQPVILNLASEEYFKAVDLKALKARVVQCVFQDYKNGAWKIISFHAKRARGLMARYAIDHGITDPQGLQAFNSAGYAFEATQSSPEKLVFRRDLAAA
ncbi:peroxide stress protein YaaA [Alcaligenaceae bacterium]|nr:peroxide stress protein YaaA [Alcaligenaceae bacterium]